MDVRNVDDAALAAMPSKDREKVMFARNLYRLMVAKGWRQNDLAEKAQIGRDAISLYVNGKVLPGEDKLLKLAEALGCEPSALRTGSTPRAPFSLVQNALNPSICNLVVNTEVPFSMVAEFMQLMARAHDAMPEARRAGENAHRRKRA